MKVAIVCADDLTANVRVRSHARALAAAGHRVTVFGAQSRGTEPEEDEAGVVYVRVALTGWRAHGGLLRSPLRLARWYERFAPLVEAAIRREAPEVLHAHDLDVALPAHDAAVARAIPFVLDVPRAPYADRIPHLLDLASRRRARAAWESAAEVLRRRAAALERRIRRRGLTASIAESDALADALEERYGGRRALVVRTLPSWRDVPRSDALRRRLGAWSTDRLLVLHGPVEPGSGAETAVRALRLLGERHVLVILGAASHLRAVERAAEEEGVAAQVRFVPPAPEDELLRLAASADVALVPTEPSTELSRVATPPRLWSAFAAGLPIAASDTRDAGRVIRRTGAGVLFPARSPQDPAALAEAVDTLLSDGSLRATCADAARRAFRVELNWERESLRLVDLYDAL